MFEAANYYDYQPGRVEAVIRCNGREVARVPIPAPRRGGRVRALEQRPQQPVRMRR